MSVPPNPRSEPAAASDTDDLARVGMQLTGRLSALGIRLDGDESPESLGQLADAIEQFEDAVESRGGDLMIDEPPPGSASKGDNADFVLPRRAADETIPAFIRRLGSATERVLSHPPPGDALDR